MIPALREKLESLLLKPEADTLPWYLRLLRIGVEVGPLVLRKLRGDNLPTAAAALTYHSVFGLIPAILLGLIAYRTVGDLALLQADITRRLHETLQLDGTGEVGKKVDEAIAHLFEKAQTLDVRAMGAVGVMLLVFAAIGLVVTVEKTFNNIYCAPRGRPWTARVPIYWAAVTLGPLLAWASLSLSRRLRHVSEDLGALGWVVKIAGAFSGFIVMYLLVLLLYRTLPAVKVRLRTALWGALVATLGIQGLLFGLRFFFVNMVLNPTRGALYGSLAVLPVCLLATCMIWLILLAGLEWAWVLHHLPMLRGEAGRERARHQHELAAAEAGMVVPAMVHIGRAFLKGKSVSEAELCAEFHTTGTLMRGLMDKLVAAGFLHDVLGSDGSMADGYRDWGLAKAPDQVRVADLLSLSPLPPPSAPGARALTAARRGQIEAVGGLSLLDLLGDPEA